MVYQRNNSKPYLPDLVLHTVLYQTYRISSLQCNVNSYVMYEEVAAYLLTQQKEREGGKKQEKINVLLTGDSYTLW